jgi:hypothetical protein
MREGERGRARAGKGKAEGSGGKRKKERPTPVSRRALRRHSVNEDHRRGAAGHGARARAQGRASRASRISSEWEGPGAYALGISRAAETPQMHGTKSHMRGKGRESQGKGKGKKRKSGKGEREPGREAGIRAGRRRRSPRVCQEPAAAVWLGGRSAKGRTQLHITSCALPDLLPRGDVCVHGA